VRLLDDKKWVVIYLQYKVRHVAYFDTKLAAKRGIKSVLEIDGIPLYIGKVVKIKL
jgi:hypothetical protein